MEITYLKNTEELEILKKEHSLVVLDFYSDDCPPCEKLAPIYEEAAKSFPLIKFVKVYRQENRELAESLNVNGSPTILFFQNGKLLDKKFAGFIDEPELIDYLQSLSGEIKTETVESNTTKYDLCIIGNGPAGLSAAVYAGRYKINQVIVGDLPGGLMTSSHKICNFPSEIEISGADLSQKMFDQVSAMDIPHKFARVNLIENLNDSFKLTLSNKEIIIAKTILLATGTKHRHLELPKEKELTGKGISYCATCDALFYTNKTVAVIGGSDSANTAALYLSKVASHVYQIYRKDALRGEVAWIDQIKENEKITVLYNTEVTEIIGEEKVTGIKLSKPFNDSDQLEVDGIFVEVGSEPEQTLIKQLELATENSYIKTTVDQKTSRPQVWAAGDITTGSNSFRQIVTACSEGAIAAENIFQYLQANK
ncbi:MAG: FAD-dependent oxidoreductase [Patescibacteria group bacterium]